jgi:hypothetical protein
MQNMYHSWQITADSKDSKILIPKMAILGYLQIPPKDFPMFQFSGFSKPDSKKFAEIR